jgi:DNA-binding MarR family transcriptional regulator
MANENELKVIEEISRQKDLTQRELSARTKLSLGTVNIILKRLVKRGVVKTTHLNLKKVEYFLTSKGFSEKTRKSYNYILKTVNLIRMVKEEIAKIVLEEYNRGQKKFVILGNDDLADIIELALKGFDYQRVSEIKDINDPKSLVLAGVRGEKTNGFRSINIRERLGEAYWSVGLTPE